MTVRRKYKSHAAPAVADEPVAAAPASPVAPDAASAGNGASPLQAALEAQQHAESLQRQHTHRQQIGLPEPPVSPAERQAIDAYVDSVPNLTDHQKRFLKSHPTLLRQPYTDLVRHAIIVARHAGIKDDSPQMDAAILDSVAHDIQRHHHLKQLTSAAAAPPPQNAAMHQDVDQHVADLQAEVEEHLAAERQPAPSAPPLPKRRSFPMTAPVSRDAPSVSGRPDIGNTLSRDEREIARSSFPHLSAPQAEYEYLQNKRKLHRMRQSGEYSEQRG